MKKIFLFISALICVSCFSFNTKALTIPKSDVYKEGIYRINASGKYYATISLFSKDKMASVVVIDSQNRVRMYKIFFPDVINDSLNIGYIESTDTIIVIGPGELAINYYTQES